MFKVSPASLQTFVHTRNCVLEDCVQYSMVHVPNVFFNGHLQIVSCVGIVRIHRVFRRTPEKTIGRRKIQRSWRPNGFRNDCVCEHVVQECHRHTCCMSCSTILLKLGFVNFIFFQLRNEMVHNIVTVPLVVESLYKKMGLTMRLRDIPTQTPVFSSCRATRGMHGIVRTPDM
jgi:hypothetical protein